MHSVLAFAVVIQPRVLVTVLHHVCVCVCVLRAAEALSKLQSGLSVTSRTLVRGFSQLVDELKTESLDALAPDFATPTSNSNINSSSNAGRINTSSTATVKSNEVATAGAAAFKIAAFAAEEEACDT